MMPSNPSSAPYQQSDEWSAWLLLHRYGGNARWQQQVLGKVGVYADKVIDGCRLDPGAVLADIGCGDGAVSFRALQRYGRDELRVVLADISAPLLRHAREKAALNEVVDQCTFVHASAEDLGAIASASVDAVALRATLAYVPDRARAMREFHRILRPGGRLSLCEPMLQDEALDTVALRALAEERAGRPGEELVHMLSRWRSAQFPDTRQKLMASPISNYTERDLFRLIQGCGFESVHVELHIDVERALPMPWESFLLASPHPLAPPHGDILRGQFNEAEQATMEALFRPRVEAGGEPFVERVVYATAEKPGLSGP